LKVFSPGPLFFFHERIGFKGERFNCIKFRTMVLDAEARLREHLDSDPEARAEYAEKQKLRSDPRIVPGIGRFLRNSSLDELPQFVNVLFGDMSIVGPRPVTTEEVGFYGSQATTYMSTRPGITGLWQVSGRSSLTFVERVRIDATYVRNWSIAQDLKIIFRTVGAMLHGRDAC
jgi:lipopolysaccharide/colanic/teichoic acid biosynthesis glycosyltransferase